MPALTITDLNNGKTDLDHIAAISTSTELTATDRLGHVKPTMVGSVLAIAAKVAAVETARAQAIDVTIPSALSAITLAVNELFPAAITLVESAKTAAVSAINGALANVESLVSTASAGAIAAAVSATASAGSATTSAANAAISAVAGAEARAAAEAAANATGVIAIYATKALATAALAGIAADAFVEVVADESRTGSPRTRYQKSAGALVFRLDMNASTNGSNVRIACAGNSIMAGTTSPNTISIPQALVAYLPALALATITNDGVPGSSLDTTITGGSAAAADMVVRYTANIKPLRPAASGSVRTYLLIEIGANDFAGMTNAQVATWCARFDTYCATARTDGFTVIAFTIMRRSSDPMLVTERTNRRYMMNDFIRRSRNVDKVVDADLVLTDITDTAVFIDQVHPTDYGNKLLARAAAVAIESHGISVAPYYPIATLRPVLTKAERARLDAASIACVGIGSGTIVNSFVRAMPAMGAGAKTVTWWTKRPAAEALTVQSQFGNSAQSVGTAFNATKNLSQTYMNPLGVAFGGGFDLFPDDWMHCGIRWLADGTATHFANGLPTTVVADTTNYTAFTRMMSSAGTCAFARARIYSRALSDAEMLADFNSLSEFIAAETSYIFALDDGCNGAGAYVLDLSSNGCHLVISDTAKMFPRQPKPNGGIVKFLHSAAASVPGVPLNTRITSWTVNVTVAGAGTVNIGDVNGNGRFYTATAGVLAVGLQDLTLLSRFALNSSTIYVNAVGYTIEHTIRWEPLR